MEGGMGGHGRDGKLNLVEKKGNTASSVSYTSISDCIRGSQ